LIRVRDEVLDRAPHQRAIEREDGIASALSSTAIPRGFAAPSRVLTASRAIEPRETGSSLRREAALFEALDLEHLVEEIAELPRRVGSRVGVLARRGQRRVGELELTSSRQRKSDRHPPAERGAPQVVPR